MYIRKRVAVLIISLSTLVLWACKVRIEESSVKAQSVKAKYKCYYIVGVMTPTLKIGDVSISYNQIESEGDSAVKLSTIARNLKQAGICDFST